MKGAQTTFAVSVMWLAANAGICAELSFHQADGTVPPAPMLGYDARAEPLCDGEWRQPATPAEEQLASARWLLFFAPQELGATRVVTAAAGLDGQCRPRQLSVFVLRDGVVLGHVAATDSRAVLDARLNDESTLVVKASFHKPEDAAAVRLGTNS